MPDGSCTESGLTVVGVNDADFFSVGGAGLTGGVSSAGIAVQIVDAWNAEAAVLVGYAVLTADDACLVVDAASVDAAFPAADTDLIV